MVVEQNRYKVVVDNQVECVVVHNLQSLVDQDLGKLEIEPMKQVQTEVGIAAIGVVEIEVATVVESIIVVFGTNVVDLTFVAIQQ